MTVTKLMTITDTRHAIKKCKRVLIQTRFGLSEAWIKISKAEATRILSGYPNDMTPQYAEMSDDQFGELDGVTLYLG